MGFVLESDHVFRVILRNGRGLANGPDECRHRSGLRGASRPQSRSYIERTFADVRVDLGHAAGQPPIIDIERAGLT